MHDTIGINSHQGVLGVNPSLYVNIKEGVRSLWGNKRCTNHLTAVVQMNTFTCRCQTIFTP